MYFDAQLTSRRYPALTRAIEAGKHIFTEKPTAETLTEAIALARLAKQKGVTDGVVHDKLYLPGLVKLRHLVDEGFFGRIISITSVVGATGNPGQANYAASKAGVTGMTKALAQELASRGVTANCVAPGFIATAMTDDLPDAQKEALNQRIPAGRMGEGSDIAAAVVYLASKEAGYVTGQTLHVNGGMAMLS